MIHIKSDTYQSYNQCNDKPVPILQNQREKYLQIILIGIPGLHRLLKLKVISGFTDHFSALITYIEDLDYSIQREVAHL